MTSGEQADLGSIRSLLASYLAAEETPEGFVQHFIFEHSITTNDAGDTPTGADGRQVRVRLRIGSTGPLLSTESKWTKALSAFTSGEQTTLSNLVSAMHART